MSRIWTHWFARDYGGRIVSLVSCSVRFHMQFEQIPHTPSVQLLVALQLVITLSM